MIRIQTILTLAAVFSAVFAQVAFGDDETPAPPTRQVIPATSPTKTRAGRRTASRKIASNEYDQYGNIRTDADVTRRDGPKEWDLKIGFLGGYAFTNTNDGTEQAARDNGHFDRNLYLGAMADLKLKKYTGFELEGFYNFAPSQTVTSVDRVSGAVTTSGRSLQQYGGMANVKGQLPFYTGSVRWEPKLGAGFGTVGLKNDSTPVNGTDDTETNTQLWGFFASVGLEFEPFSRFVLMGDYARSFGASGRISTSSSASLSATVTDVDDARFERWRATAYYRFTDRFMAGTQYVGRRLTYGTAGNETQETLHQFLGLIMVGF